MKKTVTEKIKSFIDDNIIMGVFVFMGMLMLMIGLIYQWNMGSYERALDRGETLACGYGKVYVFDKNIPYKIDLDTKSIYFPLSKTKIKLEDCIIIDKIGKGGN